MGGGDCLSLFHSSVSQQSFFPFLLFPLLDPLSHVIYPGSFAGWLTWKRRRGYTTYMQTVFVKGGCKRRVYTHKEGKCTCIKSGAQPTQQQDTHTHTQAPMQRAVHACVIKLFRKPTIHTVKRGFRSPPPLSRRQDRRHTSAHAHALCLDRDRIHAEREIDKLEHKSQLEHVIATHLARMDGYISIFHPPSIPGTRLSFSRSSVTFPASTAWTSRSSARTTSSTRSRSARPPQDTSASSSWRRSTGG